MAACVEKTVGSPLIYCQTKSTMERTTPSSSSSLETSTRSTTNPENHRCSFSFHTNNIQIDASPIINQEANRKRQLSPTDACNKTFETARTVTNNSCRSQTDSKHATNESKKRENFDFFPLKNDFIYISITVVCAFYEVSNAFYFFLKVQ